MMKPLAILLLLGLLLACSREWRTDAPVQPATYTAPAYRAANSVGRLGRLAVLAVDLHLEADAAAQARPDWRASRDRLARALQLEVRDYLVQKKGYDALVVDEPAPARDEDSMRAIGGRLRVDGVVLVERWFKKPWSTAKAVMNVFLLNVPLFQALSALNLRVSIYEAASGRLVWRHELTGEMEEGKEPLDLAAVFGDLENAVPIQLRR